MYLNYIMILVILIIITVLMVVYHNIYRNWMDKNLRRILVENPGIASADSFFISHFSGEPGVIDPILKKDWGFFVIDKDAVLFLGYQTQGIPIRINFSGELEVSWFGRQHSLSSDYWFLIKEGKNRHFFSAENGALFSGNEEKTKEIFDIVGKQIERRLTRNQ